jgi:hypothetical protein
VQNTINTVAEQYLNTDLGKQLIEQFSRLRSEPGWKFYQGFIIELGNHLSSEVLSPKFQRLPAEEKLVKLAAYSKISDFLKFFINPVMVFDRIKKLKDHNRRVSESPAEARRRRQSELTRKELKR